MEKKLTDGDVEVLKAIAVAVANEFPYEDCGNGNDWRKPDYVCFHCGNDKEEGHAKKCVYVLACEVLGLEQE